MSRTDDLVEELLTIEDSYHAKERRHKKIPKKEIVFSATDKDKAVSIIMKLIKDHKLNVEEIKEKIDKQVKWDKFWRINELLDDIDDIQSQRLEEAYKRLSFSKTLHSRLGKHSNVELREHELVEDILSNMTNDKVKSGKKKTKRRKSKRRKSKKKRNKTKKTKKRHKISKNKKTKKENVK